ncbi:MAG: VPLPA-CTERM sorting domain-containing protein [Methylococcaceae bacterium]
MKIKKQRHVKSNSIMLASALLIGLLVQQPVLASLTFTFNYNTPNVGFNDPTLGAGRRAALEGAANSVGAYFSTYSANLVYDITSDDSDDFLVTTGSFTNFNAGNFQPSHLQQKVLSNGVDPDTNRPDGVMNWNFTNNFDVTDNVTAGAFDMKAVAMHELIHSFGFASFVGDGGLGAEGFSPGNPDTWRPFDNFLTDAAGNRLISTNGVFQDPRLLDLTGGTDGNGVFFNGANALLANGGEKVNLFSPNPFEPGSSIGHLDDDFFINTILLMESTVSTGPSTRILSDIELGILKDIGYSQVGLVPIPAAIWLMGSGLIALSGMSLRRKSTG